MIDFIKEHWIEVAVLLYIVGNMYFGYKRGFVRSLFSLIMVFLTISIVNFASPFFTQYMRESTNIETIVKNTMLINMEVDNVHLEDTDSVNEQEMAIYDLNLPDSWKKMLSGHNNVTEWSKLGTNVFHEYIRAYIADKIIHTLSFGLLFIIVWLSMQILVETLHLFTKLPVIHEMNKFAGAGFGLLKALVLLWIVSMVLTALSGTDMGNKILTVIRQSVFLEYLYQKNPIGILMNWIVYFL